MRPCFLFHQRVQKFVTHRVLQKLARGQSPQRLRPNPISFSERSNKAGREGTLAKSRRGRECTDCEWSSRMQSRSLCRLGPRAIQLRQIRGVTGFERFKDKSVTGKFCPLSASRFVSRLRTRKILLQNLAGRAALLRHHCRALLAKPHAMAPSSPMKCEVIALPAYLKPCARNFAPSQRFANGEPKFIRADFGVVQSKRHSAARFSASRDRDVLPSRCGESMR